MNYSLSIKKDKRQKAILFLFLFAFLCLFVVPVFADMRKNLMSAINEMLDQIFGSSWTQDVMDIVIISDDKYGTVISALSSLYAQIEPIGYAVAGMYMVIAIVEMSLNVEEMTWEKLLRPFIRTMVVIGIISMGMKVFVVLTNLGSGFLGVMKDQVNTSATDAALKNLQTAMQSEAKTKNVSWDVAFLYFVRLSLPWVISWILRAGMMVLCYSIVFEIFLRVLFAPIAVGDIAAHGIDGPGFRYLKSLVAAGLRSALMMAVVWFGGLISSSLFQGEIKPGDTAKFVTSMIVVQLVTFTLARGTEKLAKEIVGA